MVASIFAANMRVRGGGGAFSPASIFSGGERGALFEMATDTCFSNTSRTTPATLLGVVAGVTDESGNNNHATQGTAGLQPLFARQPVTGRRNLLTWTEEFNNAAWANVAVTISANAAVAPNGETTAEKLVETATTSSHYNRAPAITVTSGVTYAFSCYLKAAERTIGVFQGDVDGGRLGNPCVIDLTNGNVISTGSGVSSCTTVSVGNGWYRCIGIATASGTGSARFGISMRTTSGAGLQSYLGDGTSGLLGWGVQTEVGSAATDYQRVGNALDMTEAGIEDQYYLSDDLVNDTLNWTAVAGTYDIAYADRSGTTTVLTGQALSGSTDILRAQFVKAFLAVERSLTAGEITNLQNYWAIP